MSKFNKGDVLQNTLTCRIVKVVWVNEIRQGRQTYHVQDDHNWSHDRRMPESCLREIDAISARTVISSYVDGSQYV